MSQYVFTQSAALQVILQDKLPVLTMDDPVFTDIMPIDRIDASMVVWEQKDNWQGLLSPRGYDGGFGRVQREGVNQYKVQPGAYGDQKAISEEYMTVGREIGTWGQGIDITRAQMEDQDHLLSLAIDRMRKIAWDLVLTGTYSVLGSTGAVLATDTFSIQSFTALTSWSDHANSTPLADMRSMKLKARGHAVRFDRRSKLYLNTAWVNHLLANTNVNDLGGKRAVNAGGQIQPLALSDVNKILADQDLPQIVEYDEGYLDSTGTFQLFIPDGKGALVGARKTGEPVSKFWMTRNANNVAIGRGATELYTDFEFKKNPIRGITSLGFNGAPAIYFPSAIVGVNL